MQRNTNNVNKLENMSTTNAGVAQSLVYHAMLLFV